MDRRLRRKVESIKRSGLEYIDKERWTQSEEAGKMPALQEAGKMPALPAKSPLQALPAPIASSVVTPCGQSLATAQNVEEKTAALKILAAEVAGCVRCEVLAPLRTQTVFSDGSPGAELCFVGEAPGADEDRQGIPFVGRAGQLLTRIIEACGFRRDEVYICNVLKCRPPENRNPNPDEVCNCRPFLERQLDIVRPRMMVALGKYATAYLLNQRAEDTPITKMRGQIRQYNGIPFMITLHPAYVLRYPELKKDVWEDMKVVLRELGRPVPK